MDYLGVNTGGHDSSVCHLQVENKKIREVNIYLSERITKVKHQGLFPYHALKQLKREHINLLTTIRPDHIATNSFKFHPYALEESWGSQHKDLVELHGYEKASMLFNPGLSFITHHLCHAYSSLYQCPFDKALVVVSDGTGNQTQNFPADHIERNLLSKDPESFEYLSLYLLSDGKLIPLEKFFMKYSSTASDKIQVSPGLGVLFETAGRLIFDDWTTAGKVMGLSAYGEAQKINEPVSYFQNQVSKPLTHYKNKKDFDSQPEDDFKLKADLAASVQEYFEETMIDLLKKYRGLHPDIHNLVLVGGCALNCLLNARIIKENLYHNVFVPPFPNDEGVALGAALALASLQGEFEFTKTDYSQLTAALGSKEHDTFKNQDKVEEYFAKYYVSKPDNLAEIIAKKIHDGEIIAWLQGRSEVGPRALGHRSILARPDFPNMKQILNDTVKYREAFRPYGATVLQENVSLYFDVEKDYQSPFMTFCPQVRASWKDKLESVTHVDGTCRIQTLMREQNPLYYDLIKKFEEISGFAVVLNTSLNIMGQPILESIEDALKFFESSSIKTMVYGDFVITKVQT